jgi:hypothetical protein
MMTDAQKACRKLKVLAPVLVSSKYKTLTNTTTMLNLSQVIGTFLSIPEPELVISKKATWNLMRRFHHSGAKAANRVEKLIDFLDPLITSIQDLAVLKFTIDHIIIPTNELLRRVPSSDKEAAEELITRLLQRPMRAKNVNNSR